MPRAIWGSPIAVLSHLAAKLPISRLQRDLTDSTVTRNLGVPLAHMLIALSLPRKGSRQDPDQRNGHPGRPAEPTGPWWPKASRPSCAGKRYPNPYEALKDLTRTHGYHQCPDHRRFHRQSRCLPEGERRIVGPDTGIGIPASWIIKAAGPYPQDHSSFQAASRSISKDRVYSESSGCW